MREIVERAGALMLARTDGIWEILWDGTFLMSSVCRDGERALGRLARGRTLIGGLGMGFTLRAALDAGAQSIDVAEIAPAVVAWNRGPLAPLASRPLDDARVTVHVADVRALIAAAPSSRWDAVLLDVDNGPSWTARDENRSLYGSDGIAELARVIAPGGVVAVWSAQAEPAFAEALARGFAAVETRVVPVELDGRASDDYLIIGVRAPTV